MNLLIIIFGRSFRFHSDHTVFSDDFFCTGETVKYRKLEF